jgi:hypothetical protein
VTRGLGDVSALVTSLLSCLRVMSVFLLEFAQCSPGGDVSKEASH